MIITQSPANSQDSHFPGDLAGLRGGALRTWAHSVNVLKIATTSAVFLDNHGAFRVLGMLMSESERLP